MLLREKKIKDIVQIYKVAQNEGIKSVKEFETWYKFPKLRKKAKDVKLVCGCGSSSGLCS